MSSIICILLIIKIDYKTYCKTYTLTPTDARVRARAHVCASLGVTRVILSEWENNTIIYIWIHTHCIYWTESPLLNVRANLFPIDVKEWVWNISWVNAKIVYLALSQTLFRLLLAVSFRRMTLSDVVFKTYAIYTERVKMKKGRETENYRYLLHVDSEAENWTEKDNSCF